ncbi:MAG: hypothetical protein LAT58_09835 [Opitutales bacterium]|nr:hypothetical protein [Opitutales bacterium]
MKNSLYRSFAILITALCGIGQPLLMQAGLPEPDVVFYGRVVHLGGGEEYLLTEGELVWTITPGEGNPQEPYTATAELQPLRDGTLSYLIRVPSTRVVPHTLPGVLPGLLSQNTTDQTPFSNATIEVDGMPVRIADPAGQTFLLNPEFRGLHRRLDLIVEGDLPDSDGDGIPDWWEMKYGTGFDVANADADLNGDGITNLEHYLAGTNPLQPVVEPQLPGSVLVSLPLGGQAILMLKPIDQDSTPEQLVYTVGTLPEGITLHRAENDLPLLGFNQADVEAGRIVIASDGAHPDQLEFTLTLRDENPEHATATTQIHLSSASPDAIWEGHGLPLATLPEPFPAVQDATRLAGITVLRSPSSADSMEGTFPENTPLDLPRLMIAGVTNDTLLASAYGDILVVGNGHTARTGPTADTIIVTGDGGSLEVLGFDPMAGDQLDLSAILEPVEGRNLSHYLKLNGHTLGVSTQGTGVGFNDFLIDIPMVGGPWDIDDLWDMGALRTDPVIPVTTLFVIGEGQPEEEDLKPAYVHFSRRGDVSEPLTVGLTWSGTATMGVDYVNLPNSITFAAGQKQLTLTIQPLADDLLEPDETIILDVHASENYVIDPDSTTLTFILKDLPSRVWLEVPESVAYLNSLSPAEIVVRRQGPLSAPLTVKLSATGTAIPALDYRRLPSSVTFNAAEQSRVVLVEPLSSAYLEEGPLDVILKIVPDPSYEIGMNAQARTVIVNGPTAIHTWISQNQIDMGREDFLRHEFAPRITGLTLFAFNQTPEAGMRSDFLRIIPGSAGGPLRLEYPRWPSAPEIEYILEWSSDLQNWTAVPESVFEESNYRFDAAGQEHVELSLQPENGLPSRFFRIAVRR